MKQLDNLKKNTLLLLLITLIVLYFILKDDFHNIMNSLQNVDFIYILVAIAFYFLSLVFRGYSNYLIINDKKKVSLLEAIKLNTIIQFVNGITPFATGGQPVEIYLLVKRKIPAAKAANQTIQGFIFYQIALVICGISAVIYNHRYLIFPKIKILQIGIVGGFLLNIAVVIILLSISFSKKAIASIVKVTIKIFKILKIKINEEKINKKIEEYHQGFYAIKKRKHLATTGIILNVLGLLCLYIVPLFIIKSLDTSYQINFANIIVASSYVYIIGSFIPIPGSSGGIEYAFSQYFGFIIPNNTISAVLILWRAITYYLGIIMGAILLNIKKKEIK